MNDDLEHFKAQMEELRVGLSKLTTTIRGLKLRLTYIQNKTEAKILSANNTHVVAHEINQKQIDTLFRMYPWMYYLKLMDGKLITREEWTKSKQRQLNREYKIT